MRKKFLIIGGVIVILVALLFVLTGCGGNTKTQNNEQAQSEENSNESSSISTDTDSSNNVGDKISETESYVGYYADIDADGTVDGVIYADLAVGGSGNWNNNSWGSSYSYDSVTNGLKDYYISQINYEGIFGTKDVVTSKTSSGDDRFFVMALEDFDSNYHYWYYSAYSNLDYSDQVDTEETDFGKGKSNTTRMITAWNNKKYGNQNGDSSYTDIWGEIQENVNEGWFVPSKTEWAAFGDYLYTNLGITTENYGNFKLSKWYLSSSQCGNLGSWCAYYSFGGISSLAANEKGKVRLSTTF